MPWGFAGMLALVVAIEWFVASKGRELCDPVSLSWRFSAKSAESDAPGCEVLCLGDSLIKHGLVPSIIEKETGRRTVNLSARAVPR